MRNCSKKGIVPRCRLEVNACRSATTYLMVVEYCSAAKAGDIGLFLIGFADLILDLPPSHQRKIAVPPTTFPAKTGRKNRKTSSFAGNRLSSTALAE